jgi:ribonucleoside-triphosphate reductase
MANGVKKTYKKLYWRNLGKSMDILCNTSDGETEAREIGAAIERDFGIAPNLADDNNYSEKEAGYLKEFCRRTRSARFRGWLRAIPKRRSEEQLSGYGSLCT